MWMARLWLKDDKTNHMREGLYCDLRFGQASVFLHWFKPGSWFDCCDGRFDQIIVVESLCLPQPNQYYARLHDVYC